jgi:hypothetical protein
MGSSVDTAREQTLLCTKCGHWKYDTAFWMDPHAPPARRYRHYNCKACKTAKKPRYQGPPVSIFSPNTHGAKPSACSPGPLTRLDK